MKLFRKSRDGHLYNVVLRARSTISDIQAHWDSTYAFRNEERAKNARLDRENRGSDIAGFIGSEIARHFGDRRDIRILELGCGIGSYAFMLLENGYDVVMSDFSAVLVDEYLKPRLREAGHSDERAFVADARNLEDIERQYDVIILVGIVYEFRDTGVPREIFEQVHDRLAAGGLFIHVLNKFCNAPFQRYHSTPVRIAENMRRFGKVLPRTVMQRLRASPALRAVFKKPPLAVDGKISLSFANFLYQPAHIASELRAAGFRIVTESGLDALPAGDAPGPFNSRRVGFAAVAKDDG